MRVLVSAYACEPGKGSESGIGWNWVRQIARFHDTVVVTRTANRKAIEQAAVPVTNVTWIYYDLPRRLTAWKRGTRGVRLYYYLWQIGAWRAVRRQLSNGATIQLVHHVTFGTYWLPSFLSGLSAPFVWGPVGGGESAPHLFYGGLGWRGHLFERARDVLRHVGELDPFVKRTARRASLGIATTRETASRITRLGVRSVQVLSHVALPTEEIAGLREIPWRSEGPMRFVSIGRCMAWKGFHLGITAFARFARQHPTAEYWIIGDGPDRGRLESLARSLGVHGRVVFLGSMQRADVMHRLAQCDVLLHPSLHDSGGYACVEAMAAGRPVIALDLGGPTLLVSSDSGFLVPAVNPKQAVDAIAGVMDQLARDATLRRTLSEAGRCRVASELDWNRKGELLAGLYARAGAPAPVQQP